MLTIISKHSREWAVVASLAALLLVIAVFAPDFYKPAQLLTVLTTAAPVLIASCGMSLVIMCRHIDISVGSQFALCSVLAGLAARAGWPMPAVAGVALLCGTVCGVFNGALVAGCGLPSIVVTLATMVTWRELLRWWREGEFVRDLPAGFQWFGLSQAAGQVALLVTTAALSLIVWLALEHASGGRWIYAVGSNAEAARLVGIRPGAVTFFVFVFAGWCTGLAAILNAVRFPDVDPKTGQGLELQAIAASIVGGVAISGGRGSLWGVLAGVLLLACVAPALVFLKTPPQWEKAIQGLIILLAVAADGWRSRRAGSRL
jgi:rhamnose transport system permease protein